MTCNFYRVLIHHRNKPDYQVYRVLVRSQKIEPEPQGKALSSPNHWGLLKANTQQKELVFMILFHRLSWRKLVKSHPLHRLHPSWWFKIHGSRQFLDSRADVGVCKPPFPAKLCSTGSSITKANRISFTMCQWHVKFQFIRIFCTTAAVLHGIYSE